MKVLFVYETSPTRAFRGSLVVASQGEVSGSAALRREVGEKEFERLRPYLSPHRCETSRPFTVFTVARAYPFHAPLWDTALASRFGHLQAPRYLADYPPDYVLHVHHVAAGGTAEALTARRMTDELDSRLDAEIVSEFSAFYNDLEHGFRSTHIPAVGQVIPSVGFSSLAKFCVGILADDELIGKCVLTAKRGRNLKVGPIYLQRRYRGQGRASLAIGALIRGATELGYWGIYATVPSTNDQPLRLFSGASFDRVAFFASHYKSGIDEVVFFRVLALPGKGLARRPRAHTGEWRELGLDRAERLLATFVGRFYFSVDSAWLAWLKERPSCSLGTFDRKPHDLIATSDKAAAIAIYKRGGTMKIVPATMGGAIPEELVSAWETHARRVGQRKVSVFWPAVPPEVLPPFSNPSYFLETEIAAGRYSSYNAVQVRSRFL